MTAAGYRSLTDGTEHLALVMGDIGVELQHMLFASSGNLEIVEFDVEIAEDAMHLCN